MYLTTDKKVKNIKGQPFVTAIEAYKQIESSILKGFRHDVVFLKSPDDFKELQKMLPVSFKYNYYYKIGDNFCVAEVYFYKENKIMSKFKKIIDKYNRYVCFFSCFTTLIFIILLKILPSEFSKDILIMSVLSFVVLIISYIFDVIFEPINYKEIE